MKLTKRKGFNFFRSYYDVYNLLSNEDKVAFMDALLDRQFLGVKPDDLEGMAQFAYVSQTNSIDSQVKGYEDKTKTKLNPLDENNYTPTVGVNEKVLTPTLQVQVEVQEKGKGEYTLYSEKDFLSDWNELRTKHLNKPSFCNRIGHRDSQDDFKELLKHYTREQFKNAMIGLFKQKEVPNGNEVMRSSPKHLLKDLEPYLTAFQDQNEYLYSKKQKSERL